MPKYSAQTAVEKREQYERVRATLWLEKSTFDQQWKECADFIKPRRLRQFVQDRNKGDRRNRNIINSTGTFALRTYANGMLSGMSPASDYWFELSTPDPKLAQFAPVKRWLYEVTEIMHSVFAMTNLYSELPTVYGDHGLFGTAAVGCFQDDEEPFRLYPYPIGTYALGVSKRGVVDTFIREYMMSVRNLIDEFGEFDEHGQPDWSRFSPTIKSLYDKGNYEEQVEVCWIIAPNPEHNPQRFESKYKRWISCHFEKGRQGADKDTGLLREAGFDQFPIFAPRFEVAAEDVYGTDSCGITAIGDIRGLQTMEKRKAQAVEKMVNPPVQAPTHLKSIGVNLLPGGTNYVDALQQQQGIRTVHDINFQVDHMQLDIERVQLLIRRAFYEDLFLMIAQSDRREITAREIEERHEEKLMALGSVLERANRELHKPLIDRTFYMLQDQGLLPEPPQELEGQSLKIQYVSILAKAQRLVRAVPLERYLGTILPASEMIPQFRHKTKFFKFNDDYADALGIDPELIATDEEAEQSWQAEQQAAAEQARAEQMKTMADAGKSLAGVPMEEDTAATRMLEAMGAQ